MAIKELVHDETVLSTPCEKATAEDAQVAQDLLDTMESLDEAACLHANQIGVTRNLFAYVDEKDVQHVMFNPSSSWAWPQASRSKAASPTKSPSRSPVTTASRSPTRSWWTASWSPARVTSAAGSRS